MNLQERIELIGELRDYLSRNDAEWQKVKEEAQQKNAWFSAEFIDIAVTNILNNFLQKEHLLQWTRHYYLDDNIQPKTIGIVMAGNIPLVGFHDFLTVFISGHKQVIKLSAKDDVLMKQLVKIMTGINPAVGGFVSIADMLKGCDAYIATGSNNSARYFEQYFGKYPNIIRRNRTSVALLDGNEDKADLDALSDDIHLYYGLGCRNITKLLVPRNYDFIPLLDSFNRYKHFIGDNKYKNNYDYQLAIMLLNKVYYMTNGNTLLIENEGNFSPLSVVHYAFYNDKKTVLETLRKDPEIQCIAGKNMVPFGQAQCPNLFTYADGIDTMKFLLSL